MASILTLEQDTLQSELFTLLLTRDGHEVHTTAEPEAAFNVLLTTSIDLIVIEPAFVDDDGERVCRQLRELDPDIPVMIVSERDRPEHVVSGLLFADDYLRKPIWPREFLARVAALLRRSRLPRTPPWPDENLTIGEIELSLNQMRAIVNGKRVSLTRREFSLLYALMENCNRVLSRDQLIELAWGHEFPGITKGVDVCILRLRKKLEPHLRGGTYIQTSRGFGYKFAIPQAGPSVASRMPDGRGHDRLSQQAG